MSDAGVGIRTMLARLQRLTEAENRRTPGQPDGPVAAGSRDRRLPGKARRQARRTVSLHRRVNHQGDV